MRKQTFLKLCGERDRKIVLGEQERTPDDLFRLECVAERLDCLEVSLEIYLTRCGSFPAWAPPLPRESAWYADFLRDAPDELAREKIHDRLREARAIDFACPNAYNGTTP